MSELLSDAASRRRSPATLPEFHAGRPPRNKGMRSPALPEADLDPRRGSLLVPRVVGGPPARAGRPSCALSVERDGRRRSAARRSAARARDEPLATPACAPRGGAVRVALFERKFVD